MSIGPKLKRSSAGAHIALLSPVKGRHLQFYQLPHEGRLLFWSLPVVEIVLLHNVGENSEIQAVEQPAGESSMTHSVRVLTTLIVTFLMLTLGAFSLPAEAQPHVYKIVNIRSRKCLEVSQLSRRDGANVEQFEDNGKPNLEWMVIPLGSRMFKIVNVHSGKCLEVAGGSMANGANVQQYADNGTSAQKWYVVHVRGETYKVVNVRNGRCLDVQNGSMANSANVQVYDDNGTFAQQWQFIRVR